MSMPLKTLSGAAGLLALLFLAPARADACDGGAWSEECEEIPDTSLLQRKIELPTALQEGGTPEAPAALGMAQDVPEADRGWALFQRVPDGPPVPSQLTADTAEPQPMELFPHETRKLKEALGQGFAYQEPKDPSPETTPDWVFGCFPKGITKNNHSGWGLYSVVVPQIVPFIVPADQANRSDVSVIIAPGGGGTMLAWESEGTDVAKWFNLLGISAFVLKYRVPAPATWPSTAAVTDAQRAVSLVRHMAPALGLNPERVGLYGSSHGGMVATFAAHSAARSYARRDVVDDLKWRPDFLILLYPELHVEVFGERVVSPQATRSVAGVLMDQMKTTMPIFVANGADDPCCSVDKLYLYHNILKMKGDPPVEINVYAGLGHGFAMCYRQGNGDLEAMKHEGCLWLLRARRFILWNVEKKTPREINLWYDRLVKFDEDASLLQANVSGHASLLQTSLLQSNASGGAQ